MTADIHLAFDHPEARAAATADPKFPDRISLRDHVVEVEIGAFQEERGTRQHICFNIVVEVVPVTGPVDDDVDKILSYDLLTEAIAIELAAERLNLLETLAERVAERVLQSPQARRIFVRIEKLDRGPGALGVEIVRSRADMPLRPADVLRDVSVPHPTVVFLSNQAIAGNVSSLIDDLQDLNTPLIFCVGMPDTPVPQSKTPAVQRRVELLAIEQNAWVLAGRDGRCVVVDTRTELDWAAKNGLISVWAPSKIVLDAVDGPDARPSSALELASWFAKEMQAAEFVSAGVEPPQTGALPTRMLRVNE